MMAIFIYFGIKWFMILQKRTAKYNIVEGLLPWNFT